jgi:hypothetical protein
MPSFPRLAALGLIVVLTVLAAGLSTHLPSPFAGIHSLSRTFSTPMSAPNRYVGDLYLPPRGTQDFGNVSTWSDQGAQFFIAPEVKSVAIPVGHIFSAPSDNPIQVTDLTHEMDYTMYPPASGGDVSSVAAIYLSQCSVGGSNQSECYFNVSTINGVPANLTNPAPIPASSGNSSSGASSLIDGGFVILGLVIGAAVVGLAWYVRSRPPGGSRPAPPPSGFGSPPPPGAR